MQEEFASEREIPRRLSYPRSITRATWAGQSIRHNAESIGHQRRLNEPGAEAGRAGWPAGAFAQVPWRGDPMTQVARHRGLDHPRAGFAGF